MKNRDVFSAKLNSGESVELSVRVPSPKEETQAQLVYMSAFKKAITPNPKENFDGAIIKAKLMDVARRDGLWDDDKEKEYNDLLHKINKNREILMKGGIKKSEAKNIALDTIKLSNQAIMMRIGITQLENNTAEGYADNERFNYLVSCCTVYNNDDKPFFGSLEDYKTTKEVGLANEAARRFAALTNDYDLDFQAKQEEYKFLREFGFVDEKYRLINADGDLVDIDGRKINENGQYIDDNGNPVDVDGRKLDKDGNLLVERQPFLDD